MGGINSSGPGSAVIWRPRAARLLRDIQRAWHSYFCFHDFDARPEGASLAKRRYNLEEITDYFLEKMAAADVKLLMGTANLFSHRRFIADAATNPDPDVLAYAAATVKNCIDATHRLGDEN